MTVSTPTSSGLVWAVPFFSLWLLPVVSAEKSVAYIYGNVASNGTLASDVEQPSTPGEPYDQMLLTDSGKTGLSMFKAIVEGEGYTISQYYDVETTLDAAFLSQFDVVLFGLHQKVWSTAEQTALDTWIRNGGGILMYSDSASGGHFGTVGLRNPVGKTAVNSILLNYGMEVAVDQGQGTRSYRADSDNSNPIVWDQLVLEGEGISPVAVDPAGTAEVLIPLDPDNRVGGGSLSINANIQTQNPEWAVLALNKVGDGHVMALFDRQPLWNDGPGSDIEKKDNAEILRRIVRYLARDYGNSPEWVNLQILDDDPSNFQVSYRQWINGSGRDGFDRIVRNNRFAVQQRETLTIGDWRVEPGLVQSISSTPFGDGESEMVTVQLLPDGDPQRWFARLAITPGSNTPTVLQSVNAGHDRFIEVSGRALLNASVSDATTLSWRKLSGPGAVSFADSSAATTTATFSSAGTYTLEIEASNNTASVTDRLMVEVVPATDIAIAINSGGAAYSAETGIEYLADVHFVGGGIDAFPNNSVVNTEDDELYNYARSKGGFTGYNIPLANGNYRVVLNLSETFHTSDNARVFDVTAEGSLVIDDIDLHAESGGKWVALTRSFSVTVNDGNLDLDVSASANNPLINAIVVIEE